MFEGWLFQFKVLNASIFGEQGILLKAEKLLFTIEFALYKLNKAFTKAPAFDFNQVKLKLKAMTTIEDQLIYLHNVKVEYLQSSILHNNPTALSFDQKVIIEIKKIQELQEALSKVKTGKALKNALQENFIDNEDFIITMKISKRRAQN